VGYVKKIEKNKFKLIADLGYRGNRRIRKTKNVEAKKLYVYLFYLKKR